jgi:hypothetical protein
MNAFYARHIPRYLRCYRKGEKCPRKCAGKRRTHYCDNVLILKLDLVTVSRRTFMSGKDTGMYPAVRERCLSVPGKARHDEDA